MLNLLRRQSIYQVKSRGMEKLQFTSISTEKNKDFKIMWRLIKSKHADNTIQLSPQNEPLVTILINLNFRISPC